MALKAEKRTDKSGNIYWFKEVDQKQWDPKSYIEFYENYGSSFLPKLIDYTSNYENDKKASMQMEYIDGENITWSQYSKVMQFACYRIIPMFFRYSMSDVAGISHQEFMDGFLRQKRKCRLYFHVDLKFSNFMINNKTNKIYLIDIDALEWTTNEYLESKWLYWFEKAYVPDIYSE